MRTLGIIAEYNPFHNGHVYHIQTAKKELKPDYTVIVMSGNFVQRGEPAIIHKWKRTEMCLRGGADLVLELPVYYATASAEYFARSAIKLLNSANIINYLSFGAESDSIKAFEKTLNYIINEPTDYKALLKKALNNGYNYPTARSKALNALLENDTKIHNTPNNILGMEYLKAMHITNSKICPHVCKRHGADHHSIVLGCMFSSASAIRNSIHAGDYNKIKGSLPEYSFKIMNDSATFFPISYENYTDMLLYKIKTSTSEQIRQIFDITEGLENRINKASNLKILTDIITQIKTKRYTFTKIQRILLHILLDIKTEDINLFEQNGGPQYVRVLGFKESASPLIGRLIQSADLPVIINLKKDIKKLNDIGHKMIEKEIMADDIYFMACGEPALRIKNSEYTFPVIVI